MQKLNTARRPNGCRADNISQAWRQDTQNRFLLFYRKIKTKRFIISHATIVIIPIQKNFDDFVAFSSFTSIL